ncbi:hypothetical protein [Wansuia hejianensis]|uniref:Uncharacterized protein n=1 Tax=Wansuia hejianensis TaxID=2763667 RepID=A0A7G9GBU5_9FIRM|nr:hypothetical protein [Wansuia hejianensis]QNM08277.1 hypothetical protein H9Q79_15545 [Wansuia hejianensis]RHV85146.1 hypothetical protein DXA96_18135 [Lachnospiraceae bacterium OF09-33XD]
MDANGRNTKEELLESIEELYGFKKELIYDPEQCALWAVRFTVNSIRYLGNIPFHGAKPMLAVEGYTAKHYDHETPVEDWDWDKCLRNQNIRIYRITDRMSGDWSDLGVRCNTQEEAKRLIQEMEHPEDYGYDFVDL